MSVPFDAPRQIERWRQLFCWTSAQRLQVETSVSACVERWREAWSLPLLGSRPDASSVETVVNDWMPVTSNGGLWFAVEKGGTRPEGLVQALFGETTTSASHSGRLAEEMAESAWTDLLLRLATLGQGGEVSVKGLPEQDLEEVLRPWSGGMLIPVSCGQVIFRLLICCGRVARMVAPQARAPQPKLPPLSPLLKALAPIPIRLQVETQEMDINLGSLVAIKAGSVLKTLHHLEVPLRVSLAGSPSGNLLEGFLGKREGYRALEIFS